MTPLTSSTCRCTSLTLDVDELAMFAVAAFATGAGCWRDFGPAGAPRGRRVKGGSVKLGKFSVVLARGVEGWPRALPPSARAWLNKRPAAAACRRLPPVAAPVTGWRVALLPPRCAPARTASARSRFDHGRHFDNAQLPYRWVPGLEVRRLPAEHYRSAPRLEVSHTFDWTPGPLWLYGAPGSGAWSDTV